MLKTMDAEIISKPDEYIFHKQFYRITIFITSIITFCLISAGCFNPIIGCSGINTINIRSIPENAILVVNGQMKGETPQNIQQKWWWSIKGPDAEHLTIEIQKKGYKPFIKDVWSDVYALWQEEKYQNGSKFGNGNTFDLVYNLQSINDSNFNQHNIFKIFQEDTYTRNNIFSKIWAVIIGISQYQNSQMISDLIFADDDARAFAQTLKKLGWPDDHIKLLINTDATERNIRIAIESWLTKAGPEDLVVLFWSGHGFPDPEDPEKVYFACYDTDIRIPATGYRMDQVYRILRERRCRNVVVMADTCHAGKLVTRGDDRGVSIRPFVEQMRDKQTVPKGWIFMLGADTDRKAIEHTSWSHGAFTKCLLDGLAGQADGFESSGPKDDVVTMGELRAYMNSVMPDITQKVLGTAKHPIITTSTGDPDIWNLSLQAK